MNLPSIIGNLKKPSSLKSIKNFEKDSIIAKLSNEVAKLNKEVLKLTQQNIEYKKLLSDHDTLKGKIKDLEKELEEKTLEKIRIIKEKDDINSVLYNKISELENNSEIAKLDYEKDTVLYQQKMSAYKHIRKENEVYAEEAAKFEERKKLYEKEKEKEIERFKAKSLLKYDKFKKKMAEDLEKVNENLLSINSDYINSSQKLTLLQNKQLVEKVEQLEKQLSEYERLNKELKRIIYENKNDIRLHKLVEKNLTEKNKRNSLIRLTKNRSDFNRSENDLTDLKIKQMNLNKSNRSGGSGSLGNISTYTIGTKSTSLERRLLNYRKIIEEKNYKAEKMILMNSHLKNRLDFYQKKFNGLFSFLEESLNNFSNDEEILNNKNFCLKLEAIKNCDFNSFNSQEKKVLLILLMKYLLPLVTINFNSSSNIGKNVFKTNLNIVNKKFNMNETFLRDETLKNAFLDKKNKIFKDVLNPRRTQFSTSVPVLKRLRNINLDVFDKKNKAII